jgi:multidrug efflux system outer membrane protein
VDAARVDVAKFTNLAAQDENALNLLVGSPVPADMLPEALGAVTPPRDVSPGLSSEVLLHRPDILQAENLLKAYNADIGAARANFFPRISLTTAIGTEGGDLSGLFKSGSLGWNYAPQIVLPIFDPRTWSALKVTKVQKEIAVSQYEGTIQAAFRDVADALSQRGTLVDQMEAQQALVDATAETYRLSNARYEKGTDIYLNVLDAQRSLYAAQQGLITIRLAKLTNQVRLYAVLGGGWTPISPALRLPAFPGTPSDGHHDLSFLLVGFHVPVGINDAFQWESAVNDGFQRTGFDPVIDEPFAASKPFGVPDNLK